MERAESWEVKRVYREHIDQVVKATIDGNLDRDEVKVLIDHIDGIGDATVPKPKRTDNVKAAHQAATRFAKLVADGKVHPETYFDDLASLLERFGWTKTHRKASK